MTDEELIQSLSAQYAALLRIKNAANRDAEIDTQERKLRVTLESMGIPVDELKVSQ